MIIIGMIGIVFCQESPGKKRGFDKEKSKEMKEKKEKKEELKSEKWQKLKEKIPAQGRPFVEDKFKKIKEMRKEKEAKREITPEKLAEIKAKFAAEGKPFDEEKFMKRITKGKSEVQTKVEVVAPSARRLLAHVRY